jgi:hypothetical protein
VAFLAGNALARSAQLFLCCWVFSIKLKNQSSRFATSWIETPLRQFSALCRFSPEALMTPEERKQMNWLCLRIQDEKDPKTFDRLVRELNELLEQKQGRIDPERRKQSVNL